MNFHRITVASTASFCLLAGCASTPMGPTVHVMPSPEKPFEVFQQDQEACKQYAQSQVKDQAAKSNQQAVGTALLGTALGSVLGVAVGNGQGAGVGAATGALAGTAIGAGSSAQAQLSIQDQYDNAYVQCMYSKGNQVPGAAPVAVSPPTAMPAPVAAAAPYSSTTASLPTPPSTDADRQSGPGDDSTHPMTVVQAQERLNMLGYFVGQPDGVLGPGTRAKLKAFQEAHGLPTTGNLDHDTVAALSK